MSAPMAHVNKLNKLCFLCHRNFSSQIKQQADTKLRKKPIFIDKLRVHVRGGAGGQGIPKYGGIGGDGGNVVFVGDENETLLSVYTIFPQKRFTAGSGTNSRKFCLLGGKGNDRVIKVPVGIVVKNDQGRILGDINEDGQEVIVAAGGKGGNPGNNYLGMKGQNRDITLDLKLIADIGLVGFPNAGKSTFLSNISRASPKIAEYPFTTIRPQIGTMVYADGRRIKVADLPGLIEGAHMNFGMGHSFLKHIERTKLLLFMVDIGGFQLRVEYQKRTAFETILLLIKELQLYREDLMSKPAVLALNKIDLEDNKGHVEELKDLIKKLPESMNDVEPSLRPNRLMKFDDIFTISAQSGENVTEMKDGLRNLLDIYDDEKKERSKSGDMVIFNTQDEQMPAQYREHSKIKLI